MTMAIDNQRQHPLGGSMGYDQMHYPQTAPQFNNPWTSAPQQGGFAAPTSAMNYSDYKTQKPTSIPLPYSSLPATAPTSYPAAYSQAEIMQSTPHTAYDSGYSSATSHAGASYPPSSGAYAPVSSYAQSLALQQHGQQARRTSSTSSSGNSYPQSHSSFGDAIEASRGMVAMAHNDITPRNIYGRPDRSSIDSYGFPSQHSSHSSISSASGYGAPHYGYAGSVDGSATDYSSASESVDGMSHSRTLPRPNGLLPGAVGMASAAHMPPAPASMMGSFNSKVSSSAQKKHKCKICDKRFTRPSSLQTHMYSHTGEKPFQCEVPGCGRNFSVVSNLRRHRKVHKNDAASQKHDDDRMDEEDNEHEGDHGSPDGSWTSERD